MRRRVGIGVLVGAGFVVVAVTSGFIGPVESPRDFVDRWLRAVSGQGAPDRGWSQLDERKREELGTLQDYVSAAADEDWTAFRWTVTDVHSVEDLWWSVWVEVDGGLEAVPAFLRDQKLVGPLCIDDRSPGISLLVADPWLFGERTLGSGGLTGGGERALRTGRCTNAPASPLEFAPGGEPRWTGHAFEVRNNTTTPLFLRLDDGSRIDLAPCASRPVDELRGDVEVRAEDGYVATFGGAQAWDPAGERTNFIVIGVMDFFLDGAPPRWMAPCDTPAQVQHGV